MHRNMAVMLGQKGFAWCGRHSLQILRLVDVGAPQEPNLAPLEAVAEEQAAAETAAKQARVSNDTASLSSNAGSCEQCLDSTILKAT